MAKFAKDLNLKETELRLGLPGTEEMKKGIKRIYSEISEDCESRNMDDIDNQRESTPTSKVQIVGWPPIRSYRKNTIEMKKKIDVEKSGIYVKVSMDGAPYLRKIDMKVYKGYSDLLNALINMFKCFSKGGISEREGFCHAFEYELTYEDKDGDWMLAGDVPWSMFVSSCKRLRIMKRTEARGMNSES